MSRTIDVPPFHPDTLLAGRAARAPSTWTRLFHPDRARALTALTRQELAFYGWYMEHVRSGFGEVGVANARTEADRQRLRVEAALRHTSSLIAEGLVKQSGPWWERALEAFP